jgi:hypothetical protein
MSRRTVLTPKVIDKIAQCFFDGLTDAETALLCEIDPATIKRARAGNCPAIKRAEAGKLQFYINLIRDGKDGGGRWVRIAWFLERRYPERFAKPEIQLSFSNSYSQNNLTINIGASEAKELEKEASPVRTKITEMFRHYRPNGNPPKDL